MQNVDVTKFWKSPQEVRIELYDTNDNVIGNKITKLHEFDEKKNSVTIKDYVQYDVEKDFGNRVVVNKVKLYYENELIGMRIFPNITMDLMDSIFITFILNISVVDNRYRIEICV